MYKLEANVKVVCTCNRTSKWKKVTLEQNIVSFEQKKRLLDRIVEETNVKNLSEFIQKYNDQEHTKAKAFARIEVQTATSKFPILSSLSYASNLTDIAMLI